MRFACLALPTILDRDLTSLIANNSSVTLWVDPRGCATDWCADSLERVLVMVGGVPFSHFRVSSVGLLRDSMRACSKITHRP